MIVFSLLFVGMAGCLIVTYLLKGFDELNLHLTFYGFILVGIGYIIDMIRKQKVEDIRNQVEWIIDKKYGSLAEDIKGLRSLMLSLEQRRTTKGTNGDNAEKGVQGTRRVLELELEKMPKLPEE